MVRIGNKWHGCCFDETAIGQPIPFPGETKTVSFARAGAVVKHTSLASDVADMLEQWRPANWTRQDLHTLEPLLPAVRSWVTAVPPRHAKPAQRFLGPVADITVWAHWELGTTDPASGVNYLPGVKCSVCLADPHPPLLHGGGLW